MTSPIEFRIVDDIYAKTSDRVMVVGKSGSGKCLKKGSLVLTNKGMVKIEDLVNERTDSNINSNINDNNCQMSLLESLGEYTKDEYGNDSYNDNIKNINSVISLSPNFKEGYKTYPITAKYDMGTSNVITIKTGIGIEITGTPEHKIIVMDKNGRLAFRKLENITEDDYVTISIETNFYNDKLRLNYIQKRYSGGYKTSDYSIKNIEYMNEDIARLLGYIISEGVATFNDNDDYCSMTITTYDKEMQDDIINICKNLGINWSYCYCDDYITKIEKNDGNPIGIKISTINFAEFISYLGYRHLSQNKEVPWSILQADKNSQIAFLRALFDGDGYVGFKNKNEDKPIIEYGCSSYELCRQLQIMLLNMGIMGRLGEHKGATLEYRGELREYEKSYRLTIYGENILKFAYLVGFGLTRKQEILDDCVKHLESTERWTDITIPHIGNFLKILYDKLIILGRMRYLRIYENNDDKISYNDDSSTNSNPKFVASKYYLEHHRCPLYEYTRLDHDNKWKRQPSNLQLKKFLDVLSTIKDSDLYKNDKNILSIFNYLKNISDLFIFDKVEKMEKGRENVYDITVEPNHSYIANGTINHNTVLSKEWLLPHYPKVLFYDIKRENDDFKHDIKIGTPEELEKKINLYDVILYQPEPSEEEKDLTEDFNQVCRIVFQNKNRVIYVDEAMAVTSPSKIPYWYKIAMTQGRSYNVGVINATQRPKNIHNTLISEAEHFFIFSLNLQGDIDKLEEMIGEDAASEIRNLPEYHFIYYSARSHKAFLMTPIGSQIYAEEEYDQDKKKECKLNIPIINYCIK